ncbi:DUF6044 family protein, partial [Priestia megaterium]|uniref:DUF6044 family protein n=1 Tax=Priestia megaterium TaxID=1404 RepID=UPI0039A12B44
MSYPFSFYKPSQPLKQKYHLFNTFNFPTFHFLPPLIIYFIFPLPTYLLSKTTNPCKNFLSLSFMLQLLLLFIPNP